jgi:hypothetical protein
VQLTLNVEDGQKMAYVRCILGRNLSDVSSISLNDVPVKMLYRLRSLPRFCPSSSPPPKAVTCRKTSMTDKPSLTILPGGTG